jgi:DNA helicase-2/ATP-dependent DNA helicase PcrA
MFDGLNAEQRLAVETVDRPVLVMAPIGTGKTRVLALRAAQAIRAGHDPRQILCLSFTNKAGREMHDRLVASLGKHGASVTTRTFHGLCASILRAEAGSLGLDGDFVIYDEEDSTEVLTRIAGRHGIRADARHAERLAFALSAAVSKARLSPWEEPAPKPARAIFVQALRQSGLPLHGSPAAIDYDNLLRDYVWELRENHALDFTDLIAGVIRLWEETPSALDRWQRLFTWIQVDEVQDTSRAEYRILRQLSWPHRRMSFFGDIDQTIYEWRGSAPFEILADYREAYHPVEIRLERNYRSTTAILEACAAVIRRCPRAVTRKIVADAGGGEPVRMEEAANIRVEAAWIASEIRRRREEGRLAWRDFAVLVRTNFGARDISRAFDEEGLPHLRVEQQKFFARAEIKAAVAHLRLLGNPHDRSSLLRFLKTPPKGIGEAALSQLAGEPRNAGLRLGDLLDPATFDRGEPFAPLLEAWSQDRVVVFDTETTGLDVAEDEIVEIAAVRCGQSGTSGEFHRFLKPSRPVGASEAVHGWSDEFLAAHGDEPVAALAEFAAFCEGCVLAGHNVLSFDVPMLVSSLARAGLPSGLAPAFDTLDLSRRFHRLPRYRLEDLARSLNLQAAPSHKAADDVAATAELLGRLVAPLAEGAGVRREAVGTAVRRFAGLAQTMAEWREESRLIRPGELLAKVLEMSGLREHFGREEDGAARLDHLGELVGLFREHDDPRVPPEAALRQLLQLSSLGADAERFAASGDLVLILTVHQAKGLEFDTVFVAQATDNEFPSLRSQKEGRLEEEHRLFYVALSRARRHLVISWPRTDRWGRPVLPSRYLDLLPRP